MAARAAAGTTIKAVEWVLAKDQPAGAETRAAFAAVRPPGHHCAPQTVAGFCLYSNVAVAARHAQATLGVGRVLVVDWDVHFGDGTAAVVEEDPSIVLISLHRHEDGMFFPCGKGGADEIGTGEGRGTNISIPWQAGETVGDAESLEAFKTIVMPIAREGKFDLVLVSAGFDAALHDPRGGQRVTPAGYYALTSMLLDLDLPTVFVLEGGYNLSAISASAQAVVGACVGFPQPEPTEDELEASLMPVHDGFERYLRTVMRPIKSHWMCLQSAPATAKKEAAAQARR